MSSVRKFLLSLPVLICLMLSPLAWGQNDFAASFNAGAKLYQEKKYEDAKQAFTKALEQDPHSAIALTNLALVEFQLQRKPMAIALFRRALSIDPNLSAANAGLKFVLNQMPVKEIPHQIETYETLRRQFLQPVALYVYQILTALLLFSSGWTFLNYLGRRKRALESEKSFPGFPFIAAFLSVGFLLSLTLLTLKIYDLNLSRGTIIADQTPLQAAPGENQASLLDLHGGFEVVVRQISGDWIQVTYPGSLTGWINKSNLLITSGK